VKGDTAGALGSLGGVGGSTPLVQELPGDSWAAFGAANYGQSLKAMLNQYAGLFGGAAARQQLQQQYGIDLDEDILSWIGDVAFFARGDSLATLDGGAVIEVTDSGKAAKGFGKLVGLLQSAGGVSVRPISIKGAATAFALQDSSTPKPIVLARSDEKVVIAYGQDAAAEALSPSSRLGDADLYDQAKTALDDIDPGLLVSMPAIVKLIDAVAPPDPDFVRVRPFLEAYNVIALGYEGDRSGGRARFVAGLK
jgi:hypothetical protein